MKKVFTVIIAVIFTLSLSVSSFAAGGNTRSKNADSSSSASSVSSSGSVSSGIASGIGDSQDRFSSKKEEIQARKELNEARRAEFKTKLEEYNAFRELLRNKHQEAINAMQENNRLRAENAMLMREFKDTMERLKENGTVLSDRTMTQLSDYLAQIKTIREELRLTKNAISDAVKNNGKFRKDRDYISMETAFDEAIAVQQYRNESLQKINDIMKLMLQLIISEA